MNKGGARLWTRAEVPLSPRAKVEYWLDLTEPSLAVNAFQQIDEDETNVCVSFVTAHCNVCGPKIIQVISQFVFILLHISRSARDITKFD